MPAHSSDRPPITQAQFRAEFEAVPPRLFFNHAAVSPLPRSTSQGVEFFLQLRRKGDPTYWPQVLEMLQRVRENFAALVGTRPERITLVTSTTHGLNLLAAGLDWQPGDRILLTKGEFPANVLPFQNLAYRGVEIDFLEEPGLAVTPEKLAAALKPRTRLFSISAVQFLTGYRADLAAMAEVCHAQGTLISVDGIQAVGTYPLEGEQWGIDFLACGGHKWLLSPLGAGFAYLTEELQNRLRPVFTGIQGLVDPENFLAYDQPLAETARRYETGAYNTLALAGAERSTGLLLACGLTSIREHILALLERFQQGLVNTPFRPCYHFPAENRSGIFYFTHDQRERNEAAYRFLLEQGVVLSYRGGNLRLSPHYWNTPAEIDRLLEILQNCESP